MSDELSVNYEAIADLADRLKTAASDLGTWGGAMPSVPAGAGSAQTATIAAHLLEQLSHLTLALESAGEALEETQRSYAAVDESSRQRGSGLMAAM